MKKYKQLGGNDMYKILQSVTKYKHNIWFEHSIDKLLNCPGTDYCR